MKPLLSRPCVLVAFLTIALCDLARGQAVVGSVSLGLGGGAAEVAVNTATDKVYVSYGHSVQVVSGQTNALLSTITIPGSYFVVGLAVNPVTNKIYALDRGDYLVNGTIGSSIVVIDGATDTVEATLLNNGTLNSPFAVAVNSVTNQVYVGDSGDGTLTIIDGATNATSSLTMPSAIDTIAVDPATNRTYVADTNGLVVLIGATSSTPASIQTTFDYSSVNSSSAGVAVNPVTNTVFVADQHNEEVRVFAGASGGSPPR